MKVKSTILTTKILGIAFLAVFICAMLVGGLVYNVSKSDLEGSLKQSLERIAGTASLMIDGGMHKEISSAQDQNYLTIKSILYAVKKRNDLDTPIYTLKRGSRKNTVEVVVTTDPVYLIGAQYKLKKEMVRAFNKGVVTSTQFYKDKYGVWISAYAPIKNMEGRVTALLKVQHHAGYIIDKLHSRLWRLIGYCAIGLIISWLAAVFFVRPVSDTINLSLEEAWLKEKKAHLESILTLSRAIEIRDPFTKGHIEKVTEYARLVGKRLGLSAKELENLRYGCMLHDLGKIDVNIDILSKPSQLTPEEKTKIRMHTKYGTEIIKGIEFLDTAKEIIQHHHEHYDGKGYPKGLKGEEIPLMARIVTLIDAFDAMTSDRPYRKKISIDEAFSVVKKQSSRQFDPKLCRIFLDLKPDILKIMQKFS